MILQIATSVYWCVETVPFCLDDKASQPKDFYKTPATKTLNLTPALATQTLTPMITTRKTAYSHQRPPITVRIILSKLNIIQLNYLFKFICTD